jgi:hypothetical protein
VRPAAFQPAPRMVLVDGGHTQPRPLVMAMVQPNTLLYQPATAVPPALMGLPGKPLMSVVRQEEKGTADIQMSSTPATSMLAQVDVLAPALPALGDSMLMLQPALSPETGRGPAASVGDMSHAPLLPPLPDAFPDAPQLPALPVGGLRSQ